MRRIVSFVIVTKNNRATITFTLASIKQFAKAYTTELIIVDGMSNDGTYDMIKDFALRNYKQFYKVKIIKDPGTSLSYARNVGFEQSSGDIVIFLDGDMLLHPSFAKNFKLSIINDYDLLAPNISVMKLDYYTELFDVLLDVVNAYSFLLNKPDIVPQARIFTREALEKLHGYPRLSKYFGEDRLTTALAISIGLRYAYLPSLSIIKIDEPSFKAYIKKHIRYGSGIIDDLSNFGKCLLRGYILTRRLTYLNLVLPVISALYAFTALKILKNKRMREVLSIFAFKYVIDLSMLVGEIKALLRKLRQKLKYIAA